MTIEELKNKANQLLYDIKAYETPSRDISDLTIQFTIEVLEELKQTAINRDFNYAAYDNLFYFKIKELKQHLDEKV